MVVATAKAVPPPRLAKGPAPVPVPNIALAKQPFLIPPRNGIPGTVTIPSKNPRRAIIEEHLLTRSGETFRGKFLGYDPAEGLKWSHPDFLPKVIHFLPNRVSLLNFKMGPLPSHAKHHNCQIELSNGDTIAGDLVRMENEKLILNTWYAGELTINTAHIKSLKPGFSSAKVFFEGPKNTKNWTFNNGQNGGLPLRMIPQLPLEQQRQLKERAAQAAKGPTWKLTDGVFESTTSNSMVGRQMKEMPARSSTEFDVEWTGSLNLYVNFLTDSLTSYSMCNGYCLRLTQSYIYLYRYNFNNNAGRGGRVGNNVRVNLASLQGNAHIALKMDAKKKTIALFINDILIQKWENLGDFPSDENGLLFTSRTTSRMKLSHIRVTDWNGNLPEANTKAKSEPKNDYVLLNNADHITGELTGIANGKLQLKSDFGEMAIGLEKIGMIHRATERVKAIPTTTGMTRAIFKGEGSMAMNITGWKDGKVTATSPIFGKASFDAEVFQSIDFSGKNTRQASTVSPTINPLLIEKGIRVPLQLRQRVLPVP
ncbi:MAG: hypothetical protein HOL43_08425, partial [Verrucomicrobiales bacterium]|nr:hypothetical protein [Verrucomicrobiales bacterium]